MYSPTGYYDLNYGSADEPPDKPPYRKRNNVKGNYERNMNEKWKEACLGVNPDFDNLPESAKEMIESKLKVEYYIALGSDPSLPRTATSGSIQTPRVSPLVKRPPRVPSRAPSAPIPPSRPLAPLGPLPPLPLHTGLALPPPVSPFRPLPPLNPVPPLTPLPQFLAANPYLASYYQTEDNTVSSSTKFIEDLFPAKKPDPPNFYSPSTSSFSVPKLAQSGSTYVGCYSPRAQFYNNNIDDANNNNNNYNNNNNNNNNDEPFDYTLEALNQWNY